MKYVEGELSAHVFTNNSYENSYPAEVLPELNIHTRADFLNANGFGINFNGGSAVLVKNMDVKFFK
jgi:hypothetical protein